MQSKKGKEKPPMPGKRNEGYNNINYILSEINSYLPKNHRAYLRAYSALSEAVVT